MALNKEIISTNSAPQAIGPYSQAVRVGDFVYLSGQIALCPESGEMNNKSFEIEVNQVFNNLQAVALAAGGSLDNVVKLTIYLTKLDNFSLVNNIMQEFIRKPYPARVTVGVNELPKGAEVEVDAILCC